MLSQLDDIIRRLSSFFLVPLINVLLLSGIIFYCSRNRISLIELIPQVNLGDGVQFFLDFLKQKTGLSEIRQEDVVRLFPGLASFTAALTAFLASASWITFLFLTFLFFLIIYLIDRLIYLIGWIVPIDYEFDDNLYAASNAGSERLRALYGLIDSAPSFYRLYGMVRASLWESGYTKDSKQRQSILSHIRMADDWFAYMKGYIALLILGLFPLSLFVSLDLARLVLCLLAAFLVAMLLTLRYAQLHQRLVEFDIDSFLSIELLSRANGRLTVLTPRPDPDMSPLVQARHDRLRKIGPFSRLLAKFYLRYQDAGLFYALKLLWRRKVHAQPAPAQKE